MVSILVDSISTYSGYNPNAKIVCATLMRTSLEQDNLWRFPDRLGGIEWIRCLSEKLKCVLIPILFLTLFCSNLMAQNSLRIHCKDGSVYVIPTENVDSITFGDADSLNVVEVELAGSWLWGSVEQGYYELLSFSKDHTYTAYDNYFTYGFDTTTYGFYSQYSAMLTLWSNGFGYQHRYNWYITGLSANALSIMTKMGPYTYYRLQPEILNIRVGDSIECADGDSIVFADGVVVRIEDGKQYGIKEGSTFIQKYIASTGLIYAYKVVVE